MGTRIKAQTLILKALTFNFKGNALLAQGETLQIMIIWKGSGSVLWGGAFQDSDSESEEIIKEMPS